MNYSYIIYLLLALFLGFVLWLLNDFSNTQKQGFVSLSPTNVVNDSTHKDTDKKIDPVNEPDYNMKNITKQSILLEEHLAEERKYCKACITKHFLHIIGLAEEATWMAGSKIDTYPYLRNSVAFYTRIFENWVANRNDETVKRSTLDTLRAARRDLILAYYLK